MPIAVNKSLTGIENLFALIHHTWPDQAATLTVDNVAVTLGTTGTPGVVSVTLTPLTNQLVGEKTVTYKVTDLSQLDSSSFISDPEDILTSIQAYVNDLPCLSNEIVIGPLGDTVELSAVANAITVSGSLQLDLAE